MCGRLVTRYNGTTKASPDKKLTDSEIGFTMIAREYFAKFDGGSLKTAGGFGAVIASAIMLFGMEIPKFRTDINQVGGQSAGDEPFCRSFVAGCGLYGASLS